MNGKSAVAKRPRGRPVGTGIDDTAMLAMVADKLYAHPSMKAASAMKQSVKGISPSYLRRLQEKWKTGRERFMVEAEERALQKKEAQQRAAARRMSGFDYLPCSVGALASYPIPEAIRQAQEAAVQFEILRPEIRRMQETIASISSTRLTIQEMAESPSMKAMRIVQESIENSPSMQLARKFEEPKWLQSIRENQEMMDRLNPLARFRR